MLYAADLREKQDGSLRLYGSDEAGELYNADTGECGAWACGDILWRLQCMSIQLGSRKRFVADTDSEIDLV